MSNHTSLQKTLGVSLSISISLLWLLAVVTAGFIAQDKMNTVFDSALEETAQRILPLAATEILSRDSDSDSDSNAQRIQALEAHDEHLTYLVRKPSGELLLQSHDVDLNVFSALPRTGFYETATHRFYGASAVRGSIYIEVAEPLAHRHSAVWSVILALLTPLLLLIPLSLLAVWWLIKRSLRKVVELQQRVAARDAGDLSAVKVEQLPAEFAPLLSAVNHLLERLRRALEAERSFTANSAHELRTPLATALAKLQRLQRQSQDASVNLQAQDIETSLRTLSALSEKLLELAKAEGGSVLSASPNDLTPILQMIVKDYEYQAPHRLHLELPNNAVLSLLDPDAFAILVRNLIENALKHGADQHPIHISLSAQGRLRVINDGAVIPAEQLALLRQRFVRANSRSLGSGIGLAIVDAIASGAGLQLNLHSPATGQNAGFEVELNIIVTR